MLEYSLREWQQALDAKTLSSYELTAFYLDRISRLDGQLNSFINTFAEQALAAATVCDNERPTSQCSPLYGIPMAHKDLLMTEGLPTTCGSKMLADFVAPYNATAVERLQQAGSILLGKTNLDEFAMGSANTTSYFGPVQNPWAASCVPGGSSGGSAAAVAARLIPYATGTDTGGSIRQPAALCGITGLKPTYGRVSRFGLVAFASSLDQIGPMAVSAEDCAMVMQALAGFDKRDATSCNTPADDYLATLHNPLKGLKIGLPEEYFNNHLDPAGGKLIEAVASELAKLGATWQPIRLPHTELAVPTYYVIAPAEASSNLARYDGVRYGYRCENPKNLVDLYERSRGEAFGSEVKRRIMIGTYVLSAGYYDAYYRQAQRIRELISEDFRQAWQTVDVILSPTTPTTAFAFNSQDRNPLTLYLEDVYTVPANLAGLPALSMPAGFIDGKPFGAQLIGQPFAEAQLLNIAHQYQQVTAWHRQLPEIVRGS